MADGIAPQVGGTPATTGNPYGLSSSDLALMGGLQGLAKTIDPQQLGSAAYMRPAPGAAWSQGQPSAEELLAQIMQMRAQAAQGLGSPYQAGVAMPKVSLLQG